MVGGGGALPVLSWGGAPRRGRGGVRAKQAVATGPEGPRAGPDGPAGEARRRRRVAATGGGWWLVAAAVMLWWRLRIGPDEVAVVVDIVRRGEELSGSARMRNNRVRLRENFGGGHIFIGRGS